VLVLLGAGTAVRHRAGGDRREDAVCIALMRDFIVSRPELWHEDIGE
jgi:hypothetical protein